VAWHRRNVLPAHRGDESHGEQPESQVQKPIARMHDSFFLECTIARIARHVFCRRAGLIDGGISCMYNPLRGTAQGAARLGSGFAPSAAGARRIHR
jgi:hypothetical protein